MADWSYDCRRVVLENGLTIVLLERPGLHNAAIAACVKTGSRGETPQTNGLSHFLEHMMFRGTQRYPTPFELNCAFESIGASVNGATTPELTEYTVSLPPDQLESALSLLADMLLSPRFSGLETERRIIIEEILEEVDEAGRPVDIDILSRGRLWPGHPLGLSVSGPAENVSRFALPDVEGHYLGQYVAGNTVLCIAGSVNGDRFLGRIPGLFRNMAAGPRAADGPSPSPSVESGCRHARRPGSQTQLRLAFRTPGLEDSLRCPVELMLRLIDDGMSTPLHRRVFEDTGLAYNVGADLELYRDTGALNIDAVASHNNISAILDEIITILTDLAAAPPDRSALDKAKNRAIWDTQSIQDYPGSLTAFFGAQEFCREASSLQERCDQITAVQPADISAAVQQVFFSGKGVLTTVGLLNRRQQATLEMKWEAFLRGGTP